MSGFNLDDYVTVSERLSAFYDKYPNGSIQSDIIELADNRVVMRAMVYREPADERPSVAHSALSIPGTTQFTRGSEIENAETSAVGRAIAMMGFEVKRGVASREEVQGKQTGTDLARPPSPEHDGIIGTVAWGSSDPVDGQLRFEPDGKPFWGFKLTNGRKSYQVVAVGELAMQAVDAVSVGDRVTIWGRVEMVPWKKGDKDMPPYPRIHADRLQTPNGTLPVKLDPEQAAVDAVVPGQESFDLAESQLVDAEAVEA